MLLKLSKKVQMRNFKLAEAPAGTMQHPNKVPFTCSLFAVDKPSDAPPQGAGDKLIRISSAVSDQYLNTFEGMGMNIDYEDGMSDHEVRFKVGVITKTFRSLEGMAMAEGYIYGKDFPDVVATVRYYNGLSLEYDWPEYQFGTSIEMEAKVTTAPDDAGILDVIEFCGTGAAILFAEAAAYKTTSFAAKNNKSKEVVNDMTAEQIKAMEDSMKAMTEGLTTLSASVQTVATEVGTIKTEVESIKAAKVEEGKKTEDEKSAADLKAAQDRTTVLEKEVADLKAAAATATPPEPERKTVTGAQLLAKFGNYKDEEVFDLKSILAAIDKLDISSADSMKLKMQARAQFAVKESV